MAYIGRAAHLDDRAGAVAIGVDYLVGDGGGHHISRQDTVGSLADEGFQHHPAGRARRAIDQIDGLAAFVEGGVFPAAREIESQARCRFPIRLHLGAFDLGVEIQIDRGAIDDFGNLIAFVVVIESACVECERAIEQRVLGAEFIGVDIFGCESQRMDRVGLIAFAKRNQHRARRVRAACFIAMREGAIDQSLIGEIELRRPIGDEAAGELAPILIHHARARIAIAAGGELAWYQGEMLLILGPAQTAGQLEIIGDLVIGFAEQRIRVQAIWVLAEKIIVTLVVEAGERIGIEIDARRISRRIERLAGIGILIAALPIERTDQALMTIGHARLPISDPGI